MVLVDTSVWIDYFNGVTNAQTNRLDALLGTGSLLTGDLILAELLQGFDREADYRRALSLMDEIPCEPLVGRENALQAARNYRLLRRRGATVRKTIDVLIGTFCIVNRHRLLHNDKDFVVMQRHLGLQAER